MFESLQILNYTPLPQLRNLGQLIFRLLKKPKISEIVFLSPSIRHSEHREASRFQTPQDKLREEALLFK